MALMRLQKALADAGIASRRQCEKLIADGHVIVDGQVVTELGTKVDPERQEIHCDKRRIRPAHKFYYLVNKPRNVLSSAAPAGDKRTILDIVPLEGGHVFTIDRLDAGTEGLLILTNDGEFAQKVGHPFYGVGKTYVARVQGLVTNVTKRQLMAGIWALGRKYRAHWVKMIERGRTQTTLEMTMREGRNRDARLLLASAGHPVKEMTRTRIGPVSDEALRPGHWRKLTAGEVRALFAEAGKRGGPEKERINQLPAAQRRPRGKRGGPEKERINRSAE